MMTHFKLYKKSLQVPLTSLQPLQWYFMEFVFLQVKILHVHSAIGKKVLVVTEAHKLSNVFSSDAHNVLHQE